ncbi:helix-turn-helix transcriptional regulator [Mucilaginibacter ginkgonis]|uniref:Helix-turn-helix transcriptional regulator n=2 Tax=Mucilaginibacter ginkgonis TaxID=2682091 RepID=A0A6I4INF4_9SPHI|nr:helix-turn-helix transcriptional regulator [Mucilaginibacter ginkgonis]
MAKAYSQEYMAYRMDCSQNAYSKIELGHTKITLIQLFKIVDVLELNLHELIAGEVLAN